MSLYVIFCPLCWRPTDLPVYLAAREWVKCAEHGHCLITVRWSIAIWTLWYLCFSMCMTTNLKRIDTFLPKLVVWLEVLFFMNFLMIQCLRHLWWNKIHCTRSKWKFNSINILSIYHKLWCIPCLRFVALKTKFWPSSNSIFHWIRAKFGIQKTNFLLSFLP